VEGSVWVRDRRDGVRSLDDDLLAASASDRPERIFEVVREVITEAGAVAGKQRRALDSTVLVS
jgi:hypothetical protein